jgi:molybdopterin-biosynthesis enzyme MoeA-like protein
MFSIVSKLIAVLLISLTISGCSFFRTPVPPEPIVKIVERTVEREINQPVMPRAIDLKEPVWMVVSEANLDEFLERNKKEEGTVVFFAMTPADYELMAYNMQEIKRYVNEMKQVVVYYKTVTETKESEEETP